MVGFKWKCSTHFHISYSLNSFKGVIWGIIQGTTIGFINGDTRSLDNGSHRRTGISQLGQPTRQKLMKSLLPNVKLGGVEELEA